jgi:enterochelin esterase-like enzyme
MIKRILIVALILCGLALGQSGSRKPTTNIPDADFPRINDDLSVTFRVQAEGAHKVQLLLELGQSTYDMVKGQDGYWEVTTKPLLVGFHYYAISVDGFSANDPGSRVFFAARKEVSGLEVPGPESDFFAVKDVQHGTLRSMWYFSKATGQTRKIVVYTPPGYDQSLKKYPVLYLQHGYGEDETGWGDQGHENFILDNLIASGKAVPMIVVNENGLPDLSFQPIPPPRPGEKPRSVEDIARVFMNEKYALFDKIIAGDLIPFIDKNFRTLPDRDHRAIAGLSMGGAQAMRIGLNHLDQFSGIGAFSPAIAISDTSKDYDGSLADANRLNTQLHLLWIGIGSQDFLYGPVKASHETLDKAGIKHVWSNSTGSHVWTVWRKYLADFAPRLFR